MSSFQSLNSAELSRVLREGNKTPKRASTKKIDTSVRTYKVWFALTLKFGPCSNDKCADPRGPSNTGNEKDYALVAKIEEKTMCRYCFLGGYGLDDH